MRRILYHLFLIPIASIAQEVNSDHVYFASAKYELTDEAKQNLDKSITTLKNIPKAYQVIIYGHTDNNGDLEYNKQLSDKRAKSVRSYFIKKGFSEKNINFNAFAYTKPITENTSDQGKAKNRRVSFKIIAKTPDLTSIIKNTATTSTYKLDAQKSNTVEYSSGTKLIIPANAFETTDGKPVTGEVTVNYTEYRNALDFIKSGIPMSFKKDNELVQFNSGGMFKIDANQGNEQLKLRSDGAIKVNFKQTQELPNMQFFAFDSTHNTWSQNPQQAFAGNQLAVGVKSIATTWTRELARKKNLAIKDRIKGKDSCLLSACIGNFMAIRKGAEFAQSKWPINKERAPVYFKHYKNSFYHQAMYELKIIKENKYNVEFVLIPKDSNSIYNEFIGYHWLYTTNQQYPFKKEWEKTLWLRVKIDYELESNFTLTFYSNTDEFTLAVKAGVNYKAQSSMDLYEFHQHNRNMNLEKYVLQKTRNDTYDKYLEQKAYEDDPVMSDSFRKRCADSLFCFYQYSKQWMDESTGETVLKFEQWLDYFNANKSLMVSRYSKLKTQLQAIDEECLVQEKKRQEEELKKWEKQLAIDSSLYMNKQSQNELISEQFKELSITNLGVWNCDQIQRLKDPVYVKKQFKDDKGNLVEPIVVYVIDKAVNGALTYNGYMDLSPYYFPVSSNSENTILAFDVDNKAYICNAKQFKECLANDTSFLTLESIKKVDGQLGFK